MRQLKSFLALLTCAVIFGMMGVFVRYLSGTFLLFQQILLRNIISMVLGSIAILILRKQVNLQNIPKKFLLLYAISFPTEVILWNLAVMRASILPVVALYYASSLLTSSIVGVVVFHENIYLQKILAMLFVGVGIVGFLYPFSLATFGIGSMLALLSGAVSTVSLSFGKHLSNKVDQLVLSVLPMAANIGISGALVVVLHQTHFPTILPIHWLLLALFGVLLLSITYLTLYGMQYFDLNLGAIVLSAELLFAPLFAFFFLREQPTLQEMLAALCIGVAIAVIHLSNRKRPQLETIASL